MSNGKIQISQNNAIIFSKESQLLYIEVPDHVQFHNILMYVHMNG